MSDDNLTALIFGALQGVERTTNMFLEDAMYRRRKREDKVGELELYRQKQPIERENAQFTSDLALGRERTLRDEQPTVPLYNSATGAFIQPPAGSKKVDVFNPPTVEKKKPVYKKSELLAMPLEQRQQLGDIQEIDDTKMGETENKTNAKTRVNTNLQKLSDLYSNLDEAGGIVNTEKGPLQNIPARIGASWAGQIGSGALGTKTQSIRNQINQIRPLLIQDIRQATQMGAKGLDSEKELEFYLQAATNPTSDIQSNLNALAVLDTAYGLGLIKSVTGEKSNGKVGGKKNDKDPLGLF